MHELIKFKIIKILYIHNIVYAPSIKKLIKDLLYFVV